MFLEASVIEALLIVGAVGGITGIIGGFFSGANSLFGTFLMGVIGGITLATVFRFANAPSFYAVGDDFSLAWGALGGLVLGFVVGRSNL